MRNTLTLLTLLLISSAALSSNRTTITDRPSDFENQLVEKGFVDIQDIDPTLIVELKYASPKNFMKAAVYGDLKHAYLRLEAAKKLALANRILKQKNPELTLLVADSLRPRHIQRRMWNLVKDTPMKYYVANPKTGSMHNYGCAVDLTIADRSGKRLDMGTNIDHFGILSQPRHEDKFVNEGKLTKIQVANRRLLRSVMLKAGFNMIQNEWWHFVAFDKKTVRQKFTIIE